MKLPELANIFTGKTKEKNEHQPFSAVITGMNTHVELELLPAGSVGRNLLTYVVIGAREKDAWLFVQHKQRKTWELPAGHIEAGEDAVEAARRELYEETGTTRSAIRMVSDYAVTVDGHLRYGRIFFARVEERGPKPASEISKVTASQESPLPATYPKAHRIFLDLLENLVRKSE